MNVESIKNQHVIDEPGNRVHLESLWAQHTIVLAFVHPKSLGRAVTALGRGFRQKRTQGDPWQQGGVFVIAPNGDTRFSFRAKFAGDMPDMSLILRALESFDQPEAA